MRYLSTYLKAIQESPIGVDTVLERADESDIGHIAYALAVCRGVNIAIYADRAPLTTGVAPMGSPDFLMLSSCFVYRLYGTTLGVSASYSPHEEPAAFDWLLNHFDVIVELLDQPGNFTRLLAEQAEWFRQR